MLSQVKKLKDNRDGFTIIEVLIVLAIAGLIMVIVFLAVPNLQKSQRNNARKTDANNALSALSDYTSNNGGQLPAADCTGTSCTFLSATSSVKFGYFQTANVSFAATPVSGTFTAPTAPDSEHLLLLADATCANGAASAPTQGTARQYAAYYGIEGSVPTQCISD
jgi:prepilin-type N-terminal cleavage/methylation domain-containing protein